MPRHLREDLFKPPSCGADDFSEGAEHLTQKVLWVTKNIEKREKQRSGYSDQMGKIRFSQGFSGAWEKTSLVIPKYCPINFWKLWLRESGGGAKVKIWLSWGKLERDTASLKWDEVILIPRFHETKVFVATQKKRRKKTTFGGQKNFYRILSL